MGTVRSKPDQEEHGMSRIETKDIDRTIMAVAKLGLFCKREVQLSQANYDELFDIVTDFLGEVNDHTYLVVKEPAEAG